MGEIIGDEACPGCKANGRDSQDNHLMVFEDGSRYCNRCQYHKKGGEEGNHVPENTDWKESTRSYKKPTVDEVNGLATVAIPDRNISKETAEYFNVKMELSTTDRSIERIYTPVEKGGKLVTYKIKDLTIPKGEPFHFGTLAKKGEVTNADLFGESKCTNGGNKLVVTEGEPDALAAFQILYNYSKIKFPDGRFPPCVVSLPTGASMDKNGRGVVNKDVLARKDFFMKFDEVILCLDQDEPGQAVTSAISDWLGSERVKCMAFSEKDACDILKTKKEKEFINAFFKAERYKPQSLITTSDVFDDAIKMPEFGKEWPWPSMGRATYGRRLGEGYYIGGAVKIGKSECLNQLVAYIVENEPTHKPLLIKGEEIPSLTSKKIAGKIFHKNFHDPTGDFSADELKVAIESIRDSFFMYHRKDGLDWDDCKDAIRSAVAEGCEDVFIDPITAFTDGMSASDTDQYLKRMMRELDNMSKDLMFTYYVFCHLNNPPKGQKPHEEGGRVKSNQFANSRAMMRVCTYMIGLERNKMEEDIVERNTTIFRVLEDRMFGKYSKFPVFYDIDTGDYLEPEYREVEAGV